MGAPCRPGCDPGRRRGRALGPGRRRRALAAWTSAAGFGLVAWGLGMEAPTPAEARQNMEQNFQRLQREGPLREPGPEAPAAARTPTQGWHLTSRRSRWRLSGERRRP